MAYNPAATLYENHPGMNAADCPLREVVRASAWGTSQNGFRCAHTGGHCQPDERCAERVRRAEADGALIGEGL